MEYSVLREKSTIIHDEQERIRMRKRNRMIAIIRKRMRLLRM